MQRLGEKKKKSHPKLHDVHSSFLQPWQKQAGDKSHLQGQQKLSVLSDPGPLHAS